MRKGKYLGGEFPLFSFFRYTTATKHSESYLFPEVIENRKRLIFESGTDAICALIMSYWKIVNPASFRIWVPVHYCGQTITRIDKLLKKYVFQFEFFFFDTADQLLSEEFNKGDVVIWVHFNKYQAFESALLHKLSSAGAYLLEDFVLASFDINKVKGHGAVNSLRKISPLSLSVSYTADAIKEPQYIPDYNESRKMAALKKTVFEQCGDLAIEEAFLNDFRNAEKVLENRDILGGASVEDKCLFHVVDWPGVLQRRKENYQVLLSEINIDSKYILPGEYQYLMLSLPHRNAVRKDFFNANVFPPIHWVDSKAVLSERQLSLPIDQRYSKTDMIHLAKLANKLFVDNGIKGV